jgi:integrase
MSLWKRGNVYWSYIYIDWIRHSQSTGTGNLRQATEIDRRFRDQLNLKRHQIIAPRPDMTFGELAAKFLAEADRKPWHIDRLNLLLGYWSEIRIGRIHKAMADDYRRRRHAAKTVSDATINRDLQTLRHILYWAVNEGLLVSNPLARVSMARERRKPRSVLSIEEEALLLEKASSHLRMLVIVALDTGMRRGELLNQRWEHVDFNRNLLFVTKSKTAGGESREIPLTRRVQSLLLALRQPTGLVFTFHGLPIGNLKTGWKAAIRRAGIRYLRFHDLRHTFNTRLMEAGVMQDIRKALMGHSSGGGVNAVYTHVELPAKREAVRKLELWLANELRGLNPLPESQGILQAKGDGIEERKERSSDV